MKDKLCKKYNHVAYLDNLIDQRQGLKQVSCLVIDYITKFEEFYMQCKIENSYVIISWFMTGLNPNLKIELLVKKATTLEQAYQIIEDLKLY